MTEAFSIEQRPLLSWTAWAVLAVALHGALLVWLHRDIQPATIELHSGRTAVAVSWAAAAPSMPTTAQAAAPAPLISAEQGKQKTTPRKAAKPRPEAQSLPEPLVPVADTAVPAEAQQPVTPAENATAAPPSPAATSAQTSQQAQGSRQAEAISGRQPEYPYRAIQRNQQGRVLVALTVDAKGRASDIVLERSSGYYLLDQAVLSFVKRERFQPAMRDGLAISSRQEFGFLFQLH